MKLGPISLLKLVAVTYGPIAVLFVGGCAIIGNGTILEPGRFWSSSVVIGNFLLLAVIFYFCWGTFDSFSTHLEKLNRLAANIRLALSHKLVLIPQIVESRERFSTHELELIKIAAQARQQIGSGSASVSTASSDMQLAREFLRIVALVEQQPSTAGVSIFHDALSRAVDLEGDLREKRDTYNASVEKWNTELSRFSGMLAGTVLGLKKIDYLA